jgi:Sap, sulfolipid-1-addressing protein
VASALTLLLLALGLALQPWSLLASVVLISSERGVAKATAFLVGWIVALLGVALITIALFPAQPKNSSSSRASNWIELVCGALIAVWALRSWRRRALKAGTGEPAWMTRVDSMGVVPAAILGGFLPNYVLVVAAVTNVLELGVSKGAEAAIVVAWVAVASLGVAAPLVVVLARGDQAPATLASWRAWMTEHGSAVLIVVFGVVGLALVVKGLVGLLT